MAMDKYKVNVKFSFMPPCNGELWSIGQVVTYLRQWFPDVRPSQLRHWEKEGLIQPHRSHGGHRMYCSDGVERLRRILILRRWFRLSLSETKSLLPYLDQPGGWLLLLEKGTMGSNPAGEEIEKGISKLEGMGLRTRCPVTGHVIEEIRHLAPLVTFLGEESGLTDDDLHAYMEKIRDLVAFESNMAQRASISLEYFWELLRKFRTWVHLYYVRQTFLEGKTVISKPQKQGGAL